MFNLFRDNQPMSVAWERARRLEKRKARKARPAPSLIGRGASRPGRFLLHAVTNPGYGHFPEYSGDCAVEYRRVIRDSGYCALVHGHVDGGYEHCGVEYADMKVEYRDSHPEYGH